MDAGAIAIKIQGDTAGFNAAMEAARKAMAATTADFAKAAAGALAETQTMTGGTESAFGGLAARIGDTLSAFSAASRGWAGAAAAFLDIGGGIAATVKTCIGATVQWRGEQLRLSGSLGIGAEEAGGLGLAMVGLGASTGAYQQASRALTQQLGCNGAAFGMFGAQARSADGSLKRTTDTMAGALERLGELKAGVGRAGTAPDGAGRTGTAPDGAWRTGTAPDGVGRAGAAPDEPGATQQSMEKMADDGAAKDLSGCIAAAAHLFDMLGARIGQSAALAAKRFAGEWDEAFAKPLGTAIGQVRRDARPIRRNDEDGPSGGMGDEGAGAGQWRMGEWASAFERLGALRAQDAADQGGRHAAGLADERSFWLAKVNLANLAANGRAAIEDRLLGLEKGIRQQGSQEEGRAEQEARAAREAAARDAKAISLDRARTSADLRLKDLDDENAALGHKVAMGAVAAQERVEQERRLAEERRQLQRAQMEWERRAAAETKEEKERLDGSLALLDEGFWAAVGQNAGNALEAQRDAWRGLADGIRVSFQACFVDLCNGTKSWGDATTAVMTSVLQGLLKKTAEAIAQELSLERMKLAMKKLFVAEDVAAKTAGEAAGAAAAVAAAGTEVGAKAAVAGAGAAASQAGIPIVGPALGAAAMAAMVGAVMALMGNLKSAAGGYWSVPHDMLASIHKDEMVLPARHSAALRDMLEGGGGGEGGGGASQGQSVTLNVSAVDAKSFDKYMKQNRGGLIRQVKGLARDFAFNT
jgi:hypothetical protein